MVFRYMVSALLFGNETEAIWKHEFPPPFWRILTETWSCCQTRNSSDAFTAKLPWWYRFGYGSKPWYPGSHQNSWYGWMFIPRSQRIPISGRFRLLVCHHPLTNQNPGPSDARVVSRAWFYHARPRAEAPMMGDWAAMARWCKMYRMEKQRQELSGVLSLADKRCHEPLKLITPLAAPVWRLVRFVSYTSYT
jgi:hypothetical protein